jgi:L-gulonate 5-dehydrogenase
MKAVRVLEPNVIEIQDIPAPKRHPGEVRIRVGYAGICGSDMAIIQGKNPFAKYPVTPGHELSGRIAEADPDSEFKEGDPVTARTVLTCGKCKACVTGHHNHCANLRVLGVHMDGGYAEEVVIPEEVVKRLPDGLGLDVASLAEPAAVAYHINRRARLEPGQDMAVIGAGVIGNLIFQVGKALGANKVLAMDIVEPRLPLALELGADWAINSKQIDPIAFTQKHVGEGFDVVFDLVGTEGVVEQAIQMARPGGVVVLIAIPHHEQLSFNYREVFRKELELVGTRLYNDADFEATLDLLAAGKVNAARLISHRMPLEQGLEAIELVQTHPDTAFKVLLQANT